LRLLRKPQRTRLWVAIGAAAATARVTNGFRN
jgi:hypothetical protein